MRTVLFGLTLGFVFCVPACKTTYCCGWAADPQVVVDDVAKANADCVRVSVHSQPADAKEPVNCASTARDRVGKPSDAEDVKAMQTGQPVVLEEKGALDVTVPILAKDGKFTAACGITLKSSGASREQLVDKAKAIATQVESGLRGGASCCSGGGSCCDAGGSCCSDKK
jgi:hypothetical protein